MEIVPRETSPDKQALYDEIISFVKECTTVPEKTDIIYQYTNIDALFNGIIVKEPKAEGEEICLWASNYLYVNDPDEIATGQRYANRILNKHFVEGRNYKIAEDTDEIDYYITSFSTIKDSLPMWGIYGKNGAGISLGFDREIINRTKSTLYKCVYLDKDLKSKVNSYCKQTKGEKIPKEFFEFYPFILILTSLFNEDKKEAIDAIDNFLSFLLFTIYAKNPAYKYEDEVRLLIQSDVNTNIKYHVKNNLIIPYTENLFPKEALKEIWVGPTTDMKRTIKSLETYLAHKGFKNVKIISSNVHYRV